LPGVYDYNLSANFLPNKYLLTINKYGAGSGFVESMPIGINCGTDCIELYDYATTVKLEAKADAGSYFEKWGGHVVVVIFVM